MLRARERARAADLGRGVLEALVEDNGKEVCQTASKRLYMQFSYADGKLTGHQLETPSYETRSWLEKVI